MSASPWPIPARPRGSPCETGTWQHLPSGAAAGVSSRAWGRDRPGVWRRVERQLSLRLPPSASLCAPVGTPGPGGSLGTSLCSASFKFTRPAKASEETLEEKSQLAVGPPGNGGTPSDGGFPRAGRWHPVHHGARRCDISAGTRPSSSASLPNLLIDSARNATWLRPDPWAYFQVAPCPSPG